MTYEATDFKNSQQVRWCPGCGDYGVLSSLHKAMAKLNIAPHSTVVISGIGCSSRLPYYMNTYGFHTIHGRGAAVATGVKVANPSLSVWLATGDGDCLAIGGNHFIHTIRRNVDINILLMNNKIYGLTKGQYSPTSDRGFVSKSSPYGTVEDPFRPAELAIGARGCFFARTIDSDIKNAPEILIAAAQHKGTTVVEFILNCVIFNNGINESIVSRENFSDKTIFLRHGAKMIFGKNNNKGIVREGFDLKAVTIGKNNYSMDDVLIHDATNSDPSLHLKLALMDGSELPVALGIIRNVEALVYDYEIEKQIKEVKDMKKEKTLREFLMAGNVWE
ncbi:2-oxoacid:ferredoxin oxidoreductase subunit beta [Candidatus Azobacteroides pseudotrichonymphae]|uniref:2-oxoglutarate ferredoxin oxidoreductase beta subunit n=1 Tax=Azobacteroides pseudotrichonymphae genomovar. CFP2 TaxID=511995 RepID=B6YQI8_AZOPC|nr:2-oxoacid:ferredoxin oxidoreductase subunit beta [Candidatus Azobacteroides pseudotrichonymphae]BAG83460.1 2-oxoglutarate ferredoxin oxidoreductase beta subunit [Candidatus Azobacteroides pseudotrichonymphae genomovar. CFP2]